MPQAGRIRCLPSVPTGPILPACFFVVGERKKGWPVNNLQSEGRIRNTNLYICRYFLQIQTDDMKTDRNNTLSVRLVSAAAFALFLFQTVSCSLQTSSGYGTYADFPQTRFLEAETVPLDTALFRYPFRIRVRGDKAVVLDLHGTDHYVQAFRYPAFSYWTSAGMRGEGPREMLSGDNIRWWGNGLWALDANKSELTCWTVSREGDSLAYREAVSLDERLLRPLDFVPVDDSTFIIPDYSGAGRFCRVNRRGCLIGREGFIPVDGPQVGRETLPALAQAWRSFWDYNPHNGVLAAVTQLGEVVEVWNLKDSTHVVCKGPAGDPVFQVSGGYGIPAGIMGFSDVQVGDSAIYAVFHGHSFRDIMGQGRPGEGLPDGGKYIYVFTHEGRPLCRYELDRYIYGIAVNEEEGIIWATDVNSDEPLLKFRLRS